MPITALFTADFSQFSGEVSKAERQLDLFEKEAGQTGRALDTLGSTSKKSGSEINSVSSAYRQFDDLLKVAGVNLGGVIRGLEDMATAAGKTYTQLGLLGTVGLAAAVGKIAYDVTSSISSFVGLDKAIGENVAAWLGWGDVAAQESAAVADALALASQRAGKTITDYNEAIRINKDFQVAKTKATKEDIAAQQEWEKANAAVQIAAQNHSAILAQLNPQVVEAAAFALDHSVSQKDVATAYKLTASEIAAVNWHLEQEKERLKEVEAQEKIATDAMRAHWEGVGAVVDQVLGVEALQKATTWKDAIDALGGSVENLRANELEQLKATMLEGIDALARMGQLTSEQSSHFANLAAAADQALQAMRPQVAVVEDLSKAMWDYVAALDAEAAAQQKADEAAAAKAAGDAKRANEMGQRTKGHWKGMAGATPVRGGSEPGRFGPLVPAYGASGYLGQTWANSPIGGAHGQQLGGGAGGMWWSAAPQITINGSVLGNKDEIARVVGDAITHSYTKGGRRQPA